MNILQIKELDQQRAEKILSECEIDLQDISEYMDYNGLLNIGIDIIGVIYNYVLLKVRDEFYTETGEDIGNNNIYVYSNYLDTQYDNRQETEEQITAAIEEGRFNLENSSKLFQFFYSEIKS